MSLENDGQQIFMGAEAMQRIGDELARFKQLDYSDVRNLAMRISNQDEKRHVLGLLDYAEKTCHLKSPCQIKRLESRLRADLSDSIQTIELTGGLTGVSSMNPEVRGELTWTVLEDGPHILASNFREGQFGWVSGRLGTGKTATGVSIMEQAMDLGIRCLSNIKTDAKDSYTYVLDAWEMLAEVANILDDPLPDPWLFAYDELYQSGWSTPNASTFKSKSIDGFVRSIRKLGGNMLLIEQLESKVPTTIQELATSRFMCHKVGGGKVTVDLRGPYRYFKATFEDFPLTTLSFKSKAFAFFATTEVVDFDDLYAALTKAEPSQYTQAIRAFLKSHPRG